MLAAADNTYIHVQAGDTLQLLAFYSASGAAQLAQPQQLQAPLVLLQGAAAVAGAGSDADYDGMTRLMWAAYNVALRPTLRPAVLAALRPVLPMLGWAGGRGAAGGAGGVCAAAAQPGSAAATCFGAPLLSGGFCSRRGGCCDAAGWAGGAGGCRGGTIG
jgi:hypothetical protein